VGGTARASGRGARAACGRYLQRAFLLLLCALLSFICCVSFRARLVGGSAATVALSGATVAPPEAFVVALALALAFADAFAFALATFALAFADLVDASSL